MGKRFFICKHCGNIIGMLHDSGVPMSCCGEQMTELIPNTTDAAHEKHVPVVTVEGNKVSVKVGSVEHPMTAEHFIAWIYLETKHGGQRRSLNPGEKPEAVFELADDEAIAAYAYCNLHGLWKANI
ncbi:MAG TPA: desulfoferrodoxin family protein [Oscillospiraceae bacterium]|nr:desulfoferrodoxin family protein [Oscillospiraceae bacterium]